MSRMLKILFTASVMINLLLLGILIGSASHFMMPPPPPRPMPRQMAEKLPADKQQLVDTTVQQIHKDSDAIRQQITPDTPSTVGPIVCNEACLHLLAYRFVTSGFGAG